ncbi:MAG: SH3 domain-containing protein [Lachnospiraceae bacterium]|nr:SH3 domain-containing protein [Lachnospiraceae bacterium]
MKANRKVIEGATVAAFALTVMITAAVNSNGNNIAESSAKEEAPAEKISVASKERSEETLFAAAMAHKMEIAPLTEAVTASQEIGLQAGAAAAPQEIVPQTADAAAPQEIAPQAAAALQENTLQAGATAAPLEITSQAGATAAPLEITPQAGDAAAPQENAPQTTDAAAPQENATQTTDAAAPQENAPQTADTAEGTAPQTVIPGGEAAEGEEAQPTEEAASEWSAKLMPNVEESLNIRVEPSEEAQLAGKLYKGAAADIVERGEEWTKISSGSVEGYVKNEFCVFDQEAETMAQEQGTVYATALTGGVRVRQEADTSEDVTIYDVLGEGKKVKVDTNVEAPEGWVAVSCADTTAYVSAEYVSVELELKEAVSIEEELEAIRKAEEAKKAAAAKSSSKSQKKSVSASYDEVTLLGALIQCEAGSECYEGKVAVGAVVMNRLRGGWAGSISGVIYQSGQFTPASSGALSRVLSSGVSSSCLQAAQEAISGVDNVGGATSFRRAGSASGLVIGNHVFF